MTAAMQRRDFRAATDGFVRGMFPATADSTLVGAIADDMSSAPSEVGLAAIESSLRWLRDDATTTFDELQVPLRCINSDMQPTDIEGNREHARDFDVKILSGVGHFPMREDPDRFNEALAEVVQELAAAGSAK